MLTKPTGEGTSKAVEVVCAEPIVVILQEFPPTVHEPFVPENVPWLAKGVCPWNFCFGRISLVLIRNFYYLQVFLLLEV